MPREFNSPVLFVVLLKHLCFQGSSWACAVTIKREGIDWWGNQETPARKSGNPVQEHLPGCQERLARKSGEIGLDVREHWPGRWEKTGQEIWKDWPGILETLARKSWDTGQEVLRHWPGSLESLARKSGNLEWDTIRLSLSCIDYSLYVRFLKRNL